MAVLVVDDDAGIRSSVSRVLRQDGYRVDLAESAADAINRDDWADYFAILLDRRLPDNSADDLLPQIRRRAPEAAILIITGYADLESSMAAIREGAADYLLKPVDPAELRARLRRFVELKRIRDELRERDEQIRFMIEHLPAGAAYVNSETGHVRANQAIERMTGYSASELQTLDDWFEKLFPQDRAERHAIYLEDRAEGFPGTRVIPIRRKDGTEVLGEFSRYCYDNHEVWLINDITEKQRVQEELRHQRDFLERLVDTAQVIVLVLDTEGCVVQFNRFTQELCGYRLEEVVGQNWFDIFLPEHEAEQIKQLFHHVVDGEEVSGHVNAIQTRDGRQRRIAWWSKTLRDAAGQVTEVLSIGHDVTALQEAQAQVVQSERLAAIGQMITGLAHESRNALQRASACLDMLSLDLDDQPQQRALTRRAQAALDELHRLYEEVRGYAAPVKLSLGKCNLADVWKTCWQHVQQAHEGAFLSLHEEMLAESTACVVDRHRIEQVIRNVMENAVAVSPSGGTVTVKCQSCELNGRPAISVAVSDQGPGLTAEQAEHIFEPFFTTKQKGTGLGMAIAQRIVDAHNGSIVAFSDPDGGATITITLPTEPR